MVGFIDAGLNDGAVVAGASEGFCDTIAGDAVGIEEGPRLGLMVGPSLFGLNDIGESVGVTGATGATVVG